MSHRRGDGTSHRACIAMCIRSPISLVGLPSGEFLENYHKPQEQSKSFHYVLLFFSIVLVAWELAEEIQFPSVMPDLPEVVRYASLWVTKDVERV